MKSIQIDRFGGPEVLVIKDIEIAKPGPKEVLIKNLSIGLNFIDIYHRTGLYPIPLPSGIGLEACGIVEEIGSEVKLFKIGEKKHSKVKDSTLILLSKGKNLKVRSQTDTKFLVISGKPINEEIARGGPFVMNTKAEILQAVQDYHNGTFVK